MSQLTLRYRFDDTDDFGWLDVAVTSEDFSGRGGFWVQWQDVKEFGERLSTYPLDANEPVRASWGYGMHEADELIVGLEIAPANPKGDLRVRVELNEDHGGWGRVRASFETNYPDLEAFRLAIASMMDRKAKEATLRGR